MCGIVGILGREPVAGSLAGRPDLGRRGERAAVARELAARSEIPKTMPQRIAGVSPCRMARIVLKGCGLPRCCARQRRARFEMKNSVGPVATIVKIAKPTVDTI
jgi:hypothetical protein